MLVTLDGEERALLPKFVMEIGTGDMWQHTTASGDGWGDPTLRRTVRIERDVIEGMLGTACTSEVYGWSAGPAER